MKDFINNLNSLYWWVSVVIVGLLLNLFSAYLKDRLDKYLSRISSWWRNRSEAQRARRQKELLNLQGNNHEQYIFVLGELRDRIRSLDSFITAAALFGISALLSPSMLGVSGSWVLIILRIFFSAIGTLMLFLSVSYYRRAVNKLSMLMDARFNEQSNNKTNLSS